MIDVTSPNQESSLTNQANSMTSKLLRGQDGKKWIFYDEPKKIISVKKHPTDVEDQKMLGG